MSAVTDQLRKLGEYNKALVAAVGGALTVVQASAEVIPGSWATGLVAAITAASVWLVKNQDKIDQAGDIGADLLD